MKMVSPCMSLIVNENAIATTPHYRQHARRTLEYAAAMLYESITATPADVKKIVLMLERNAAELAKNTGVPVGSVSASMIHAKKNAVKKTVSKKAPAKKTATKTATKKRVKNAGQRKKTCR